MERIAAMLARSPYYSLEDLTIRHPDRHSVPYGTQDAHKRERNREGYHTSGEAEDNARGYAYPEDRPKRL